TIACVAVFAECIASDWPLFFTHDGAAYVLPAVTHPERFRGKSSSDIARSLGPHDIAIWPLLPTGPSTVTEAPPLAGASLAHPLGTDAFGRDVAARLVYGTRTSLGLGLAVAIVSLLAGYALGALAGLRGGLWDSLIERGVEIIGVFPAVV